MENEKISYKAISLAAILICVAFFAFALWAFVKFGLAVLMPFLIGWGIALLIVPTAKKMAGKKKKLSKFLSICLLFLLLGLVVLLLALAFDRLVFETGRLIDRIGEESETIGNMIDDALDFFENLTSDNPLLSKITDAEKLGVVRKRINEIANDMLTSFATTVSVSVPKKIGNMIRAFPSFLLFVLVTLIAGFYFCFDLDRIHQGIRKVLPQSLLTWLTPMKKKTAETAVKYLRAYILLLVLTFGELLFGFSILKIDYSFLLAALIAFIDILPVFGVGSVLIPWSVVLLISGNYYRGLGLIIVYACVTIVRQIAEPRIVGGSIGLHPLITLFSMYAGFKFFGIGGMIVGPAIALAVKSILDIKKEKV